MGRIKKGRVPNIFTKEHLIKAIRNTYDNSEFMAYFCVDDEKDFTRRHCCYSSGTLSRNDVLKLLYNSQESDFKYQDKKHLKVMLNPKHLICTGSIRDNQIYHTVPPEGYHHIFVEALPHYYVYFKVNHDQKTISFLLGSYHRTLKIREHTVNKWKLLTDRVNCDTAHRLEEALVSSCGNRYGVDLGRNALQIKHLV